MSKTWNRYGLRARAACLFARYLAQSGDPYLARYWVRHPAARTALRAAGNGRLSVEGAGLTLEPPLSALDDAFVREAAEARLLREDLGARFERVDNARILVHVAGIQFSYVPGSLGTAADIFLRQVYGLFCARPTVVLDVGMNKGLATLFFARLPEVVHVRGYEPFQENYGHAIQNLALNPELAEKVVMRREGLSDHGGKVEAEFSSGLNISARVGREYSDEERLKSNQSGFPIMTEQIDLRDASEAIAELMQLYPECDIIAKVDCEGSEYGILEAWERSGQLLKIRAVLMEWHHLGREPLIERLQRAGFTVFSSHPDFYSRSRDFAMIFASR